VFHLLVLTVYWLRTRVWLAWTVVLNYGVVVLSLLAMECMALLLVE